MYLKYLSEVTDTPLFKYFIGTVIISGGLSILSIFNDSMREHRWIRRLAIIILLVSILFPFALASFWPQIQVATNNSIGDFYIKTGQYDKAVASYTYMLEYDPVNTKLYYKRAIGYALLNENDMSLVDFTKAQNIIPTQLNNDEVLIIEGYSYESKLLYKDAVKCYSNALSLNENNDIAYLFRAIALQRTLETESIERSIDDLNKYIQLNNNNPHVYYLRGEANLTLNKTEETEKDFSVAIKKDSKNTTYLLGRASVYADMQRYSAAIKDLTNAIQLDSTNADLYYERGLNYKELNDSQHANDDFTIAIELGSSNTAKSYFYRSEILWELENKNEALRDISEAILLDVNIEYLSLRAYYFIDIERYDDALNDAARMLELDSESIFAYVVNAISYFYTDKYEEASNALYKAVNLNPKYFLFLISAKAKTMYKYDAFYNSENIELLLLLSELLNYLEK